MFSISAANLRARELGPCSFRWWAAEVEQFDRCWDIVALADGKTFRLRHALGRREAYGKQQAHLSRSSRADRQWKVSAPTTDASSAALLSLIRGPDGRLVRRPGELLPGYEGFPLADHASEIRAPYSRRAPAQKPVPPTVVRQSRGSRRGSRTG